MKVSELRKLPKKRLFAVLLKLARQNKQLKESVTRLQRAPGLPTVLRHASREDDKIVIETKKQLAMRGVPSPDYAEALVLNYAQGGSGFHFASI